MLISLFSWIFSGDLRHRWWTVPCRRPYCLSSSPSCSSRNSLSLSFKKFLNNFPAQSRRQRGLYVDGESSGLSPFLSRTRRAFFHALGKQSSTMHLLYTCVSMFDYMCGIGVWLPRSVCRFYLEQCYSSNIGQSSWIHQFQWVSALPPFPLHETS